MKTSIKVNRVDNLTTKQRDKIIESPYTINLTGEVTSRQRIKNRINNRRKKQFLDFMPKIIAILILLGGILISIHIVSASYNGFNKETIQVIPKEETIVLKPNKPSGNLCQNLAFSNPDRFEKECDTEKVNEIIMEVKSGTYKEPNIQKTSIKWNNRLYSVQVWNDRVATMKKLGYSKNRILDLLAIMNMECGEYTGKCFNGNDIGPFQINKIHKEQYNKSWEYYNKQDWSGLFLYQLDYANKLLDSYDKRFCSLEIFKKIGRTYTNKRHFECIGKSYNGHPRYKYAYVKLGWERRNIIKTLLK